MANEIRSESDAPSTPAINFLKALISYLATGQQHLKAKQKSNRDGFNSIISVVKRQQIVSQALATQLRADLAIIRNFVDDDVDCIRDRWDLDIDPLIEALITRTTPDLKVRAAPDDDSRISIGLREMIGASTSIVYTTPPKGHLVFLREEFQKLFQDITQAMQAFRKLRPTPALTPEQVASAVLEFRDAYQSFSSQIQQISYSASWQAVLARKSNTEVFNGLLPSSSFTVARNATDQKPALLASTVKLNPTRPKVPRLVHGLASLTSTPSRIADLNSACACKDPKAPNSSCRSINIWGRISDADLETFTSELHFEKHMSSGRYRSYLTSAGVSWLEIPQALKCVMADDLLTDDEEITSFPVQGPRKWVQLQRRVSFPGGTALQNPVVRVWFTGLELRLACALFAEPLPLEMSIVASKIDSKGFDVTVRYPHSWVSANTEDPVFQTPTVGFSWFAHEATGGNVKSGTGAALKERTDVDDILAAPREDLYTTATIPEGGSVFVGLSGFVFDWQTEQSREVGLCDVLQSKDGAVIVGPGGDEGLNWKYDWIVV